MNLDPNAILDRVRRDNQAFRATVFWRDVREVGVSLLMIPLWVYLGLRSRLPWTWYLTIPALLWIAGYMLVDRRRHRRGPLAAGEPLRQRVGSSLAEIEHQIRLLRSMGWWYLLPIALAMLAFFGQVFLRQRGGGWWDAIALLMVVAISTSVLLVLYWVNQRVVRTAFEPRRRELESLLLSLDDGTQEEV